MAKILNVYSVLNEWSEKNKTHELIQTFQEITIIHLKENEVSQAKCKVNFSIRAQDF